MFDYLDIEDNGHRRDSYSSRICDQLSEEVLKFLSFSDKTRLQCVCKLFERTVFNRQTKLFVQYNTSPGKSWFINDVPIRQSYDCLNQMLTMVTFANPYSQPIAVISETALESVLKKCPKITCIGIDIYDMYYEVKHRIIKMIVKYCQNLTEVYFDFNHILKEDLDKFITKFERSVIKCQFYSGSYSESDACMALPRFTDLEHLNLLSKYNVTDIYPDLYLSRGVIHTHLRCLSFWLYSTPDLNVLVPLMERNKLTLEKIDVWVYVSNQLLFTNLFGRMSKMKNLKRFKFDFNCQSASNYWYGSGVTMDFTFPDHLAKLSQVCHNVKKIEIRVCTSVQLLYQTIEALNSFKRLKALKLYIRSNEHGIANVPSQVFREMKQLSHLWLDFALIDKKFLTNISENLPEIRYLSLKTTQTISNYELDELLKMTKIVKADIYVMIQMTRVIGEVCHRRVGPVLAKLDSINIHDSNDVSNVVTLNGRDYHDDVVYCYQYSSEKNS